MGLIGADDVVNTAVMGAQAACDYAVCWAPATDEMSAAIGRGNGGPFSVGEAAAKWYDGSSKLQEASEQFTQLVGTIPRDYWSGDDRDHFDTEMKQFEQQLNDAHTLGEIVAITLTGEDVPLGLWPLMASGVGIAEFLSADYFYAFAGVPIWGEEAWAQGEVVTGICATVVNVSAVCLIAIMAAGTAAIAAGDAVDVTSQSDHGDKGVVADFGQASVDSAAEIAINVAVDRVNSRTSHGEQPAAPGKHEGEELPAPPSSHLPVNKNDIPTHMPRHLKPPEWNETYKDRALDFGKDKAAEKGGEFGANGDGDIPGLTKLINQGINWGTDGEWNKPDAPDADDENWGA